MRRRAFEQVVVELSLAAGRPVPRYRLWLFLREAGYDPEWLGREELSAFCGAHLEPFLAAEGWGLPPRALRRLRRRLLRIDPRHATPDEALARLGSPTP